MAPEEVTDAEEPQWCDECDCILPGHGDSCHAPCRADRQSLLDEVAALKAEATADQARAGAIITELANAARAQLAEKDLALAFKEGQYHDEMAEAVAEVAALKDLAGQYDDMAQVFQRERDEARRQVKTLRGALYRYGVHDIPTCNLVRLNADGELTEKVCTCGLADHLAASEGTP